MHGQDKMLFRVLCAAIKKKHLGNMNPRGKKKKNELCNWCYWMFILSINVFMVFSVNPFTTKSWLYFCFEKKKYLKKNSWTSYWSQTIIIFIIITYKL